MACRSIELRKNLRNDHSQPNRPMLYFHVSRKLCRSVGKPIDGVGTREYISFGEFSDSSPEPQGRGPWSTDVKSPHAHEAGSRRVKLPSKG